MSVSERPFWAAQRSPTAAKAYKAMGRTCLMAVVMAGLVMNGAVTSPYEPLVNLAVAGLVVLFLPVPIYSPLARRTVAVAGLTVLAGALWISLQALPFLPVSLAHPVWADIAGVGQDVRPLVSVAPARTLSALPQFALPPLVFLTVLALCQDKRSAARMWIGLSLVGLAVLALSIGLELFLPDLRFFSSQPVAFGTFSGAFVNRNIAASVFVLTAFALAGTVYLMKADARRRQHASGFGEPGVWSVGSLLCVFGLFAAMIAVIATQSRAGTFLGLPILFLTLAAIQSMPSMHDAESPPGRLWLLLRGLIVLVAGGGLLLFFAEPVLVRFETYGLADPRWCAWQGTLAAIQEHPWTGTGFGTFVDTFPAYRDPECGWLDATWVRAHNGFLEMALGLGVPATVLLFGLGYAVVIGLCVHGLRHRRSLRAMPLLTLGMLAFVSVHSVIDFPMQIPGVALYCAALLGAGSALCIVERAPLQRQHIPSRSRARDGGASRRGSAPGEAGLVPDAGTAASPG